MRAVNSITIMVFALVLGACASHVRKREYSEIDVATATGCGQPSMSFNELRDDHARPVAAKSLPIRVKPGTYQISLECSWTHDESGGCVSTHGNPELKIPAYDILLYPNVRYAFSCDLEGKEYVIRMRETNRQ